MANVFVFVVIFATIGALMAILFVVVIDSRQSTFVNRKTFHQIAKTNNGSVGNLRQQGMYSQFHRNGIPFRVSFSRLKGQRYIKVTAPISTGGFRMRVFAEHMDEQLKKFIQMQDIIVGRPQFDDRYVVQSNDENRLHELVSRQVQDRILELGKQMEIRITRGVFSGQVAIGTLGNELVQSETDKIVDVFMAIWNMVAGPNQPSMIDLHAFESNEAICMICGEDVVHDKVVCRACRTPHHRDCWEYVGQCSTYACGNKRYALPSQKLTHKLFRIK